MGRTATATWQPRSHGRRVEKGQGQGKRDAAPLYVPQPLSGRDDNPKRRGTTINNSDGPVWASVPMDFPGTCLPRLGFPGYRCPRVAAAAAARRINRLWYIQPLKATTPTQVGMRGQRTRGRLRGILATPRQSRLCITKTTRDKVEAMIYGMF